MEARELERQMGYQGMEKDARKILLKEELAKPEYVAVMTSLEVCEKLLEHYEVVSCEEENITIVKHEDMATYDSIVTYLSR